MISVSTTTNLGKDKQKYFDNIQIKTAKDCCNVIAGSKCWSPIVFRPNYRHGDNFHSCSYAVVDIDDGMTIIQAKYRLSRIGCSYIIGTTKSHGLEKISGKKTLAPCDRFRIIIPFELPITSKDDYTYNMQIIQGSDYFPKADQTCKCHARFYWPCKNIVEIKGGAKIRPLKAPPIKRYTPDLARAHRYIHGRSKRIEMFLREGVVFKNSRHGTILSTASYLSSVEGKSENEIVSMIDAAPFDRQRLDGSNITTEEIKKCVEWFNAKT